MGKKYFYSFFTIFLSFIAAGFLIVFINPNIVIIRNLTIISFFITPIVRFLIKSKKTKFVSVLILSFFLFAFYFQININNYKNKTQEFNKTIVNGKYLTMEGIVRTSPEIYNKEKGYFIFKISDNKFDKLKGIKVRTYFKANGKLKFFRGDTIRVYAKFYPIRKYDNFYKSFSDYYLLSENISGSAYIKSIKLVERIKTENYLYHYLSVYKHSFSSFLDEVGSEESAISIIKAMIIGERKEISDKYKFIWKESGIYHLLAISGAHIGLLSLLLFYFLKIFGVNKRVIYYFQIIFIGLFLVFIGYNPPVFRASLLIIFYFIGKLLWKDVDILHLVSFTGIIYLLLSPLSLLGIGFILSYYTTILLIFVFRKFSQLFFISLKIESSIYLVFFAFLISLPLNVLFFNYAPFGSIIINLISMILVPFILLFSLVSLLLFKLVPIFAIYLIKPAVFLVYLINLAGEIIGTPLFLRPVTPPFLIVLLYIITLLIFILIKRKRGLSFLILIALMILLCLYPEYKTKYIDAFFLNVGQGDAAFVETPTEKFMIDCGGSYKKDDFIGEYIVSGFLFKHRIKTIDALFISHFHPDHYYGCLRVIKNFNVKNVYIYKSSKEIEGLTELRTVIDTRKTKLIFLKHGEKINFKNSNIFVIHPDKEIINEVTNNDSMVLTVILKNKKILWTGDLEKEGENKILQRGENIYSDILKVGHHGSKTSSTVDFLKAVSPRLAVISVGKGNRYHLPSKIIMERLKKLEIKTLLTSENGGIKLRITKNKILYEK